MLADIKMISISFLIGSVTSFYFTSRYKDAVWQGIINEQKIEAARILQESTENVIRVEREQNEIRSRLEVAHAQSQKKMDNILVINRTISRALGGLRDPGASRTSCKNTMPSTSSTPRTSINEAPRNRLSNEATEFLLEFARDADRASEYAKVCHDWSRSIERKK